MKTKQFILGVALSAIMGGGVAVGSYKLLEDDVVITSEQQQYPTVHYTSDMRSSNVIVPEGLNFVKAAQVSTPAVVHVMTEYSARPTQSDTPMDPFLREFFGDGFGERVPRSPQMGSGSGVIIASNGYIVTNNHVIDKADKIEVVMNDKRKFEATLVGTDPTTDIALLKINADKLPTVRYGNSDELQIGEWVLAVGNPMNLTSTVTAGIVSAKGRSIDILSRNRNAGSMSIESFIQTDAAVNPGNSGGALVNLNGDLVGINTAIASPTGSFSGYSFAVPSSIVSKVVDDLLKYGEVQRALLGAQIQEIDAAFAKEKDLKTLNGVYIAAVTEQSGAEEAGLKAGDVLTAVNDVRVAKSSQLLEQIARYRPGDKVKVTFVRDGKEKIANVTLKNLNNSTELVKRSKAEAISFEGAKFSPVTRAEMSKLGIDGGAKISGIADSKFRDTGMKDGFIITRIDRYEVKEPADVQRHLKNFDGGVVYIEGVYPDGLKAYYPIGKG
ncbi:Do/DeqQ family serine protease [Pontibacter ummariensis]|uniref:Do/DeqQ family serine protease n=1 Tax=Pontibacter ummariensis TaxID=1610492 RepID=A0A239B3I4_9BACT|nr:Do family serine endopeptidase [Pontibacter ummariensis]PRY16245.1 Do/DeqQ family serine protease [Pontibacter ummariensis]SNS01763.1 Do/DeqQ family serine protease [Pontibacter ummariensis]